MSQGPQAVDLAGARQRAAAVGSEAVWRSLEELARTDEFRESVEREFPASTIEFHQDGFSRRNFVRLMGASMALAGVYGCSERPSRKILPYVRQPEQIVPGMPLFFATAMPINGYGHGVLVESHEGRPTKIEGNPDHPASLGATNVLMQASVLQLYDPERSRDVRHATLISAWETFNQELRARLDSKRQSGGKGVRILTGTVTSPTLAWQIGQFLRQFPQARWHHYDPLARVNTQQGARAAFGKPVNAVYRFHSPADHVQAKTIVSLDCDFLWDEPGSLQYARQFADARKVRVRHWWQTTMSRLYVIESMLSLTGSMADHRIPVRPGNVADFARALAARLGVQGAGGEVPAAWARHLDAMVKDLQANKGASLVLVGESMPPEIHALGHAMNAALDNVGKTVLYTDPVEFAPTTADNQPVNPFDSLRELTDDMNHGQVDTLLIIGGNPAYDAPGDINFGDALFRFSNPQTAGSAAYANFSARLGLYDDETTFLCQWQLPEAHYLESWGDVRAFDGTASIIQPLIAPIYGGRTAIEVMDSVLTPPSDFRFRGGYEIVRQYWQSQVNGDLEAWWSQSLERGAIAGSAFKPIQVSPVNLPAAQGPASSTQPSGAGDLEIIFRPDPSVWDGSFSNNGWLQECPKFFTKLVWDNAALISPNTAERLKKEKYPSMADGSFIEFRVDGRSRTAPVMVLPGLADGVVLMHFGYGRTRGGTSSLEPDGKTPRGFDAYALRSSRSPWQASGVSHRDAGGFHRLVVTRNHFAMDTLPQFGRADVQGDLRPEAVIHPSNEHTEAAEQHADDDRELRNRKLIRTATLEYFNADEKHRNFVKELGTAQEKENKPLLSLYPGWDYSKGYQWGMSIDVQSCIGCNACLVACVAENNIAVVGREEVARQREMHWIRIDQYFASSLSEQEQKEGKSPLENPRVYHQPVPCMHCENAPCELVCPVGATAHSEEGLNMMVYNRCVGTRYCSNNCPYKVRRFNFFNWMRGGDPAFDLQKNPQVTVRSRGVMEKCTYCVQRLNRTKIEIEKMVVREEERARHLEQQKDASAPERQQELASQIQEIRRNITASEFRALETLQTACQQVCPTGAIAFGSILPVEVINDKGEREKKLTNVAKLKQEPMDYSILSELTTTPRTTYMARLRNPNPDLEPKAES